MAARNEFNANTVCQLTRASAGRLTVADNTNLRAGSGPFTVMAWVKLQTASGATQDLVAKYDNASACEYRLQCHTTLGFRWITSVDGTSGTGAFNASAVAPDITTWFCLIGRYDPVTTVQDLFVNNVLQVSGQIGQFAGGAGVFAVGGSGSGATNNANATFGPVGFFKGRALTTEQCAALYNGGLPLYYAQLPGDVQPLATGWWNMNEATGNRLDSTGNANHLAPFTAGVGTTTGSASTLRTNT